MSLENNMEQNNNLNNNTAVTNRVTADSLRRIIRRCSYCREGGHIISACNHPDLLIFENLCISKKYVFTNMDSPSFLFASWLSFYAIENSCYQLIRAYAVKKCGVLMRTHINTCIEKITNFMYNILHEEDNENYIRLPRNDNAPRHLNDSITTDWIMQLGFSLTIMSNNAFNTSVIDYHKYNVYVKPETTDTNTNHSEDSCCPVCYENIELDNFVKLNCGHEFCGECTKKICNQSKYTRATCAFCRTDITDIECKNVKIQYLVCENS